MFCIKIGTMTEVDAKQVFARLASTNVSIKFFTPDPTDDEATYMVVENEPGFEEKDPIGLLEADFQWNFKQVGAICPHCDGTDPCIGCDIHGQCGVKSMDKCPVKANETCGHLTFGSYINSEAFDKAVLGSER